MPDGAGLPRFDEPLFGDADVLSSAPGSVTTAARSSPRGWPAPATPSTASTRCRGSSPLHADLHGGNLKWHEGRLAVFDFDDAGLGLPVLDLAITTFYLRRGGDEAAETALREGYTEVLPWPDVAPGDLEALVASRQLLLANDLLGSSTASLRAMAADYLVTTVARLRHWFDTGTFRLDVEG